MVSLNPKFLSSIGYIVEDIAAAWLYTTNSKFAIIAWPISNKDKSKEDKDKALDLIFNKCENIAKRLGYDISVNFTNHQELFDRFEKRGYIVGDSEIINLMKGL